MNQKKWRWKTPKKQGIFWPKSFTENALPFQVPRRFCAGGTFLSVMLIILSSFVFADQTRAARLLFFLSSSQYFMSPKVHLFSALPPSLPPATNWLSKHNFRTFAAPPTPAIFFLTLPLAYGCGCGEAVTTVKLTPGPLFSLTIHLWAPRCGFVGIKWCLQHISVNFQQGFCTYSSGNFFPEGVFRDLSITSHQM